MSSKYGVCALLLGLVTSSAQAATLVYDFGGGLATPPTDSPYCDECPSDYLWYVMDLGSRETYHDLVAFDPALGKIEHALYEYNISVYVPDFGGIFRNGLAFADVVLETPKYVMPVDQYGGDMAPGQPFFHSGTVEFTGDALKLFMDGYLGARLDGEMSIAGYGPATGYPEIFYEFSQRLTYTYTPTPVDIAPTGAMMAAVPALLLLARLGRRRRLPACAGAAGQD